MDNGGRRDGFLGQTGGALRVSCLQLVEAQEGSGDLAVQSVFVTQKEFVGVNAFRGSAPCEECAERGILGGVIARGDVVVETDLLHSDDAVAAPAG